MTTVDSQLDRTNERSRIASAYQAMMQQIVIRTEAVGFSIAEVRQNQGHQNNWQNAEFCYLQIRKICEYLALSVLAAHHEYDGTGRTKFLKAWHAADIFDKISELNPYAFPVPIKIAFDKHGEGSHYVEPDEVVLKSTDLATIYGKAGDRLHVGNLRNLLSGQLPPYDLREVAEWRNMFVRTLNVHMIRLPHVGSVLMVHLKGETDGEVQCAFADAEGPFVIDSDATVFNVDRVH